MTRARCTSVTDKRPESNGLATWRGCSAAEEPALRGGKRTRGQPTATAAVTVARVRLYCCCCCMSVTGPRLNGATADGQLENIAEPDGDEIAATRTAVLV